VSPLARPGPRAGRLVRWPVAAAAGAAALAVVAAAGGFEPVGRGAAADLPVLALDQLSPGQPWNVTVHGARLVADLEPGLYLGDEAHHWFALILTLEVTGDTSRWDVAEAVRVTGADGLVDDAPQALLVRDATRVDRLHPGLPEQVFLLWERSGGAPLERVDVEVISRTLRESSIGGGNAAWFDPRPRARLSVPVVDQRDEA
jgi:hypothetical protein